MAGTPGTFRFPEVNAKPSAPPAGYALLYIKTDNVLYLQDSSGVEIALGSSSSITQLTGDVSATGPGIVAATVNFVGGSSAAQISAAVAAYLAATSSNMPTTLVLRDASGNFSAGTITANVTGNVSGSSSSFTGSLVGDVTGTQSATSIASTVVTSKLLTGYVIGSNTPILSTDTILQAFGKLQGQASAVAGTAITALTGDVTAVGPGSSAATVVSVGGSLASNIHSAELAANAATSSNTINAIVKRDGSGNFSAGIITASLTGNVTGNVSGSSSSFTGSLVGDVTGTQSATVVSSVGGSSAANVHSAELAANAATSVNTPSAIVKRDGSGNFSAGIITASLTGNVTGNLTGNVTGNVSGSAASFTGSLAGDVTGTQTATAISDSTVTGKLLTGYSIGSNSPILSTDTILQAFQKLQGQASAVSGSAITALTGDVTATGPGSVASTVVSVGGSSAANVHSAELAANAATSVNTASTIVKRDASGNFAAGSITANLIGNVSGSATSFTGSLAGDVAGTQGATVIQPNVVSNSKLSQMPANTLKGNNTGSTANAIDLTTSQAVALISAITTVGAFNGGVANSSGATATSPNIFFQSASVSFPGMVDITTQSFAGDKTFTANVTISSASTTALVLATSAFVFDSTNSALGIGTAPGTNVFLDAVNSTGASKTLQLTGYGTGSTVGTRGRFARGTSGSPAAAQTGDIINFWSARGYGTSQFAVASTAVINAIAGETFTNTSNLTYLAFNVTPTGSVTSAEAMRIASTGITLGPQSSSTAIHQTNGGLSRTTRTITANLTIDTTTTDDIVFCNQSSGITITLPAPTNGRCVTIKDISGTTETNNITVVRHASEKIENLSSSRILYTNFGSWTFTADGTNWWMI